MEMLVAIEPRLLGAETVNAVSARDVWKFMGVGRDFSNWIKGRLEETQAVENVDYIVVAKSGDGNFKGLTGTAQTDLFTPVPPFTPVEYFVTLDLAKHLGMLERNEVGRRLRQYFVDCERQLRAMIPGTPRTFLESLKMLVQSMEFSAQQQIVIAAQDQRLIERAPAQ